MYIYVYIYIYIAAAPLLWALRATPLKGGRRHPGDSPFYNYSVVIQHIYGKSPVLIGTLTISRVFFNNYVKLPDGKSHKIPWNHHFPMGFLWFSCGIHQLKGTSGTLSPAPVSQIGPIDLSEWSPIIHRGISPGRIRDVPWDLMVISCCFHGIWWWFLVEIPWNMFDICLKCDFFSKKYVMGFDGDVISSIYLK